MKQFLSFCAACAALLAGLACAGAACAAEPLPVTVFYSKDDPRWPDAEKAIDAVTAKFAARVRVEKVSLDDREGYARLARTEKELAVEKPGDLTAVVGRFVLTSQGAERREVESYLAAVLTRLLDNASLKERREARIAEYATEAFGPNASVARDPRHADVLRKEFEAAGVTGYRVFHEEPQGTAPAGWLLDVYREVACPVCPNAHFLLVVSEELKVRAVKPQVDLERFGAALDAAMAERFLVQYVGREAGQKPAVDTISGATKTSLVYDAAITQALEELKRHAEKAPGK